MSFCPRDGHAFVPGPFDEDGVGSYCAVCGEPSSKEKRAMFGPKRAESTIGDYYERKREAAHRAALDLAVHVESCDLCQEKHHPCPTRKKLKEAWLDAGNTGD